MNISAEAIIGFSALMVTIIGSAAAVSGRIARMETLLQTTIERTEKREGHDDKRLDGMDARISQLEKRAVALGCKGEA